MVARKTATRKEVVGFEDKRRVAFRIETLSFRIPTKFFLPIGKKLKKKTECEEERENRARGGERKAVS